MDQSQFKANTHYWRQTRENAVLVLLLVGRERDVNLLTNRNAQQSKTKTNTKILSQSSWERHCTCHRTCNCKPNTKKLCMQNNFILEVKKADINIHFSIQIKERSNKSIHPFGDASFAFLSKGDTKKAI